MRLLLFVLGLLVSVTAIGTPAQAEGYPWCAYYGGRGGGTNCGFSSYQQCMATLRGMGGACVPNNQYSGPSGRHRPY